MRTHTRIARTVGIAALMVVLGAGGASAATSAKYTGLYVSSGGSVVGEIDRTTNANNLVWKDTDDADGDFMKIQAPTRDRSTGNGHGVHVTVTYKKHGDYCYVSGVYVDGEGGWTMSSSCTSGWNSYGSSTSADTQDSAWTFWEYRKAFDSSSDSIRGSIHICQTQSGSDPCSGDRLVGISY